ncbi:hypothetical protein [Flavobacterium sp.]|uniref:hypothetical protein n=1 Tax=Flavobacterium sp. TaxID=239 RepID=UPI0037530D3F
MEEIKLKLLEKYNSIIEELEKINLQNEKFLNDATTNKDVTEADMVTRMTFAKDNYRRLQFAIAERESIIK